MFVDTTFEKNHFITRAGAQYRVSLISDVSYEVQLAIPKGEVYFGKSLINFSLDAKAFEMSKTHPVEIDFRGVRVTSIVVNGIAATEGIVFDKHVLGIPKSALKAGKNNVHFSIYNKYRKDGVGFHSFTDSMDGEQYLYT